MRAGQAYRVQVLERGLLAVALDYNQVPRQGRMIIIQLYSMRSYCMNINI